MHGGVIEAIPLILGVVEDFGVGISIGADHIPTWRQTPSDIQLDAARADLEVRWPEIAWR
ncbi:hypothetical protein ACR52_28595 [Pseudomonas fildesensis]|uniref:Uncharacterized protein n=1 Tax=Pseudomonas fildesensis TaxID=1674920 RepID=A0A0J8FQ42_9PSED|nr:hypothetical protein ACR52_28595 [Pseudomonas fildesensis]